MKNGGFYREAERLLNAGYWPIDIKPGEKRPHRSGWSAIRLNMVDVEAINKQAYDPGVGVLCGIPDSDGWSCVAIDIDVMDETQAGVLVSWCHEFIGDSPERYGRRPKALLVYKYRGELKKAISGGDKGSRIEVLGTGQQFVAYGVHPDTGKEYEWVVPLCGVDDLIEITMDQIEQLFEKWYQLAPEARENLKVRYDSEGNAKYVGKSIPELVMDIIDGNNLHDSLVHLSQQWRYDGISDELIIRDLKGYMSKSAAKKDRPEDWQKRYDDIERIVRGANRRDNQESFSLDGLFEDYEEKKNVIPNPPGLLGVLVDDAYNMALFRYREVAFVSAIGVIAAICGRKFNVVCPEPTGLNVYMTLLADSGVGKDSIIKFMSHVFYNAISDVGTVSSSFFSSIDYTGPKPLMDDLRDARSKLVLTNEAGLSAQQKSGNREGLKAAMLKLYSRSHSAGISDEGGYSKKEDRYGALKSPALSVICESTPENLLESFRQQGAIDNGQLARQSVFRVRGDIPYPADNIQRVLTEDCTKKLKHLASKAAAVQALDDPNAHEMYAENDEVFAMIAAHHRMCIDMRNKHRLTDKLKEVMWSRAHVKALRYAGIACVFNREEAKIFREEWEWATRMVDYEMACVDSCFSGGGLQGDPLDDVARRVAGPVIKKLIDGKYPNFVLDKRESSRKIFSRTGLLQVLKNNKEIAKFNDDPSIKSKPISGLKKIINHMLENGYIVEVNDAVTTRAVCYRLTSEFAVWGGL